MIANEPTPIDPPSFSSRLGRRTCEILVVLTVAFVALRIVGARSDGTAMANRERHATDTLKAIHAAQRDAIALLGTRFLWLSELRERAAPDSPLAKLFVHTAAPDPKVEVFRVRGYLVALFLTDPTRNDGRAWSRAGAESDHAGEAGFGAFAWPEEYAEETQWAFYVDHRGQLLGTWNHKAAFDGFEPPFPPVVNPLKDFNQARRDDGSSEWFLFDEVLGEIETPAAKSARSSK